MSTNSPDCILGFDADDATPANTHVCVIYHNGADTPTTWDKWSGQLSRGQYDDLHDAAGISEAAFNTEGGNVFGGWFNSKPPGFKKAARVCFDEGKYPA